MKYNLQDMTRGPLAKQILLFSLPLILSNLLQLVFNMSDVAVVGRFAGSIALGAVGSTTTLVTLFTGFLIGMGAGVNVLVARHYGAKGHLALRHTVHTAALLCLIIGILILAIGLLVSRPILQLLHTKPDLLEKAVLYIHIYFLGMPALALYNFGNAVLSATGDTRRPLLYLSLSGVVNILLNLLFVIVFRMDVAGVAIASVISQYLSAALILVSLMRNKAEFGLRLRSLRLHPACVKSILSIGLPAGFQNAIFAVANLFIQMGVNAFNTTMVSGNAAAANADGIVYDVMAAFYTACGSFMGQNYGASKKSRVKKSYLLTLAYAFGAGAILGSLFLCFGRQFLALFSSEQAVIDAGMKRLTIMSFSYAVSAFMDCTIAASRSLGKTLVPTIVVILGSCAFRIAWIYTVFAHFQTIPSLYLLYIFSWSITAIAEMIYFLHCYKKQISPLTE